MAPAPWDSVAPHEQLFVLVTGANSGIGLGICQRVMDDFLASHPESHHLILLPTTRTPSKSRETIRILREYLISHAVPAALSRYSSSSASSSYSTAAAAASRVHVLSLQLDLCHLGDVYSTARALVTGPVSNPGPDDALVNVRVPRLDAVVFNAGFGGWDGVDYAKAAAMLWRHGIVESFTYPDFKLAEVVDSSGGGGGGGVGGGHDNNGDKTHPLPKVFCANVLGHYCFAHALLPLLSRTDDEIRPLPSGGGGLFPGRVVWESSIEPVARHLDVSNLTGFRSNAPYESSKRLTDVLALSHQLPAAKRHVESFFTVDPDLYYDDKSDSNSPVAAVAAAAAMTRTVPPRMYVTHPGVVVSALFPLNAFLYFWYWALMCLVHYLGSPWHCVTPYLGAAAPAWVATAAQDELDAAGGSRCKWGSACGGSGSRSLVKKTEVPGWGWEGKVVDAETLRGRGRGGGGHDDVDDDGATGIRRMAVGRSRLAVDTTEEALVGFEELGAQCWEIMERIRRTCEAEYDVKESRTWKTHRVSPKRDDGDRLASCR